MKTLHTTYNNFAKRLVMSLMVLMTVGVGTVFAQEETVIFGPSDFSGQGTSGTGGSISATKDGVTFSCDKGYGTTQFRCYKGGKITISSSQTITAISFTCSENDYWGGLSASYTGLNTSSWEFTTSGQARITSCTVTYTTSGGGDDDDSGCITLSTTQNYPFNSTSSSNTSVYSTTIDGITFENKGGYKYNSYLSFNKSLSGAYIANTTPFSGNIESIVVNYNSGGSAYFTMYEGSSSLPSSTIVSPSKTGTGEVTYTFSGNNAYFKLALTTTGQYCNISSITICCSATPQTFTVTYHDNGAESGDVPTDPNKYASGVAVTVLGNTGDLVKTGYRFDGWQIDKAGTLYNAGGTFNISANTTLYAQWTERQLTNYRTSCTTETTVTLDPNGGTISNTDGWMENGNDTYSKIHEGIEITLPTATKINYNFGGWYNGETKYESIPSDLDESITLTAKWLDKQDAGINWDPESVTVTIDADGNTLPVFNNPNEIEGITFSSSNSSVVAVDANGVITLGSTETTATVTITATFEGNDTYAAREVTCTLTVNPSNCRWVETDIANINSGDEVVVTMTDALSNTYALPNEMVTNESDIPAHAVTATNGYITNVSSEIIWIISKSDDVLTFESKQYTGSFLTCNNADKGILVNTGANKQFVVDGTYGYLKNTTNSRYLGVHSENYNWYSYALTPQGAFPAKIIGQTLKFYKKVCLDSEKYWVTWDAGEGAWEDGSSKKLESYQVGATITIPAENPTREGYRFDGWTPAPTTMPAKNTTFTAVWTEVYKITWYENGVPSYIYVPSDNAVVTWDDNIADCGEKKFYGWTADDTFVSDPTTPPTCITKGITINGDATYHAVYADAVEPANPGYVKVTTISEGTYLIAAPSKNIAYQALTSDVPATISNDVISSLPEGATELLVELGTSTDAGYFAISYNNNGTKTYIYGADKSLNTTNTAKYDWSLDTDNATIGEIQSRSKSGYYIQANNTNGDFKAYAHTQTVAYLYKKQTTSYENFAVSCDKYTITVTPPTGGTVTTTPADEAGQGQTITVNITPADCKYLTALKYYDGSDHAISIANTPYTFVMPATDVTVTATFADKTATDIEILTSAHRLLMQGSAFVGEQVRITYNNGDKETLNWDDSRLTFSGHNTANLGSQTVTVTFNGCGTQSASYNIEVIDGLGITFWDGDYTETIKYEPGDLVDVDNKIGQNICSGWEFVGWSETKVANESNGFTPVHNFNATEPRTLYAVYVQTSTDWISAYNIDELHPGAKYVIVEHYSDGKEFALTNTNNTSSSYLDGANLTTDCEKVREGDAYPYKDRYKLKVTPDENWKWQLKNTGSGWTMRNISANKYLKINTDKTISLTTTPDDKFTLSNEYNDSEITAQSSSNNYLSWYNSSKYWNGHTSGKQYYLTNETNFTSTPPCSPLSATFYGNGGIVTDGIKSGDYLPIKEPTRDAGITTPTASFADCNGKSWTFVGWSDKEVDVTRVPVLTTDLLHDGGGNKPYKIQEDGEEFWAVFTNIGNPETKYGTITFTDADVTREYTDAKTIKKSVTAMGDYDFELYHVSNASSKGIQFDHEVETRGYIKNITSLGKINSISLNDFQTGDIDDVKVYVGNMPNAINTLLTEADLQQTGDTYTYYPQKNYAYVKIEATGYCGITSISIDFGKGTQVWATTPDCSTITLSGDELYVTSTNGQSIRAAERLTVKAVQLESKAKVVISSNSSDIYFSDVQDANFTQAVKPTETLTLTTDVDGNLSATEIYVHYRPSVDGTGIPEDVVVSANLETPNPSITDDHTIHVRNLPADFVIAAKWGDNWYAMPANMDSQSSTEGWLIEVDDAANPTKAIAAPNTTKYGLKAVHTSDHSADRFAEFGERLVFVENVEEETPVAYKTLYNGGTTTNKTSIQVFAQYANYHTHDANPEHAKRYEWTPSTTDLKDYILTSAIVLSGDAAARTISLDNHGTFGTLLQDKAYNGMVRLLPVDNFYDPAELQVVEWKQESVSVMYTGAGTKYTTKLGNKESSVQTLSSIDHAVYSLSTEDLTSATNQPLTITIKDNAEATIGAIKLTIPAIVATDKSSSELGVTQDIAKATSVVVLNGATLTAADATKYTYDDITVYPGGKLVIGQSGQLGMYSLTLRAGSSWGAAEYEHKYPEFVLNTTTDGAYSNTSGKINLDYVTTKDQYYTFVAPFEVKTKDIKYPVDIYGSNVAAANTGSYEFQYYDGAARARGETGWNVVNEDPNGDGKYEGAPLTAHQGYTFLGMPKKVKVNGGTSTRQTYGIHRIPMSIGAAKVMEHENTVQTTKVSAYRSEKNNNSGWNLIGNPYMTTIGGFTNNDIQVGELVKTLDAGGNWTGGWHWDEETMKNNQRFLVIPSNDGQSYEAVQASNAKLPAFKNFFVQIDSESNVNALSIPRNKPQAQLLAPVRRTAEEIAQDIELAIVLEQDAAHSDQMDFLINEIYSAEFDRNADFTKMMNATDLNLYGVHPYDNLSFVAMDNNTARGSVAIGYQVPQAGEYTLRMSDKPYVMFDKIEALYVTDHEMSPEVTTDIMSEPYRFTVANAETNHTRFTVSVILKTEEDDGGGNVGTGVDNTTNSNTPCKFIYQDKMYILLNGVIYDAMGKQVQTINK